MAKNKEVLTEVSENTLGKKRLIALDRRKTNLSLIALAKKYNVSFFFCENSNFFVRPIN